MINQLEAQEQTNRHRKTKSNTKKNKKKKTINKFSTLFQQLHLFEIVKF
jgi:hypothetical protein